MRGSGPLVAGVVLAAGSLGVLAAPAQAAVPGCDQLTVESVRGDAGALTIDATVPASLGLVNVPATAFSYVEGGASYPVRAERRPPAGANVAVLLARAPSTTPASFRDAVFAVRELLMSLPAGSRAALVTDDGEARVLAPLSADRSDALTALATLELEGPVDTGAGVDLALGQLPAEGRNHLVLVNADATYSAPPELPPDVALHVVGPSIGIISSCPASGTDGSPIGQADAVASRLGSEYVLTTPATGSGGLLQLRYLDTTSSAALRLEAQEGDSRAEVDGGPGRTRLVLVGLGALVVGLAALGTVLGRRRWHRAQNTYVPSSPGFFAWSDHRGESVRVAARAGDTEDDA